LHGAHWWTSEPLQQLLALPLPLRQLHYYPLSPFLEADLSNLSSLEEFCTNVAINSEEVVLPMPLKHLEAAWDRDCKAYLVQLQ
jgi:hypothetical protein